MCRAWATQGEGSEAMLMENPRPGIMPNSLKIIRHKKR